MGDILNDTEVVALAPAGRFPRGDESDMLEAVKVEFTHRKRTVVSGVPAGTEISLETMS